jgi:quercetin dioxygenase-like cupin family protein
MTRRAELYRWDALPLDRITDMVARKVVTGTGAEVRQVYFKKGAVVPLHVHMADVLVYVLQGALRAHVAGEDITAREGDVLVIPPGVAHQTESLDDTFVMTFGVRHDRAADGPPADAVPPAAR